MHAKIFFVALVASPLVAAHGKVAVVVSNLTPIIGRINIIRLVMLVETPPHSGFKVALFLAQVQIPKLKSILHSSNLSIPSQMGWVKLRGKERTH